MNGLVLANNMLWMYFFWECTHAVFLHVDRP